jgi:ABC-type branched-subunit amino acid transport system permease subunit
VLIYFILFKILPDLPANASSLATSFGLDSFNHKSGDWPGLSEEVQRLKFLFFGLILVLTMLLRPQGLIPSRIRQQELTHATGEEVFDAAQA